MKNILFISATNTELKPFINDFANKCNNKYTLNFKTIGIGLIHSLYNLNNILIENQPDLIIYVGISGALNPDLKTGDIILPDISVLIDNGYYYNNSLLHYSDSVKYPLLKCNTFNFQNSLLTKIYTGNIGSTNIPVFSKTKRLELFNNLNIDCVDMESFSVAYLCNKKKIPILTIKSISDTINDNINEKIYSPKDFLNILNINEALNSLKKSCINIINNIII